MTAELGYGLAAVGRPGYINLGRARDLGESRSVEALQARAFDLLDAAWAGGIRFFDTARSYGLAERFLGQWLRARSIAAQEVFVSSKWGYRYTADWQVTAPAHEIKEHSLAMLRQQWPESESELGPWLRLYQVHSATLESGLFERPEVFRVLAVLKERGLEIGLSTSGPRQAEVIGRALTVRVDGKALFSSVQATWNLLETSAAPALAEAASAGWRVIVKEALANGRLLLETERLGAAPDATALAAALAQPWCSIVLSGAVTTDQLASNLQARQVRGPWPDMAEDPQRYWKARAALPWG